MAKIVMYQKPTCTTCRLVHAVLQKKTPDFEAVNYYEKPLTRSKLKELLSKMGATAFDILRTKDEIYKELRLAERISEKKITEEELVDFMIKHPDLIQRPIVEKGNKAILARPPEKIKEIL